MYVGTAPSGETLRVRTATPRKDVPEYDVTVEVTGGKGGKTEVVTFTRGFEGWFDAAGGFVAAPFQGMLAGAVPVVGRCDPKRAKQAVGGDVGLAAGAAYSAEMLSLIHI